MLRWEWNGQKIAQDTNFGTVNYIKPGQSGGGAPTVMNDWVILNTNGIAVTTTMSIVAINQANPKLMASMRPGPRT